MKKLLDNKFLFIVAFSLVVLIILGVGAFYLFDDSDDVFVKKGYVINPLSGNVEKYFFNENTAYHENLSSMVEFKDVDDNDVTILKDSFLHYMDGSLSFLKNGAILDLNSINGTQAVTFYNITSKSIIEKNGNEYVIETNGDDIKLKNFIGRINTDKYIVVGSIEAKIPGNNKNIEADYFEIVYTDQGVVNIENKDVKYQVTADGTLLYVGNVVIDLGNKKIMKNDEDVMSITAITINGDENIEIIPKAEEKDDEKDKDDNGNGTGENGNGGAGENGQGGTGKDKIDVEVVEDIIVSLKDASIGSTNVDVVFDIFNQTDEDSFTLKVTNLDSGRTIDMVTQVLPDEEIKVNLLSPNTKYLFTVINERDGGKYFQKIFETTDFGIKLEKAYATDSELGYKITVSEGTDITNAKLSLYKYNEETKQNEIVTTSYYDAATEEVKTSEKVTYLSSSSGNIEGVHEIVYDGLDSDTIYTAVLDEFSLVSSNFKDVYNITLTAMTLKKTPSFNDMTVTKNVGSGSFKLALGNITDEDNAIINYTYMIYEQDNPTATVINPISKTNASPIEVKIGDKENELSNDTNYFYKVVIEYYDNEKYIEYITTDSINFVMGSDPFITVVPNNDKISYDRIGATIYLTDNSCLISMPGREKCNGSSSTVIDVSKINPITGEKVSVYTKLVDFEVSENEIKYELDVDNLQSGTTYSIEVRANRNDKQGDERVEILHSDESRKNITTKSLSSFVADWTDKGSGSSHVINLQTKFIADEGTGTLSPEETAASIKRVVVKLYEGNNVENIQSEQAIATRSFLNSDEFNIKENFYDNGYVITTDETFGLNIDGLKALNDDGKLSEYYTVVVNAYYDINGNNEVLLTNNVSAYKISPLLLMENIEEPKIEIEYITKKASGFESNLKNDGTHVGYLVTAAFDRNGLIANALIPENINLYVYDGNGQKVSFYIQDNDSLVLVDHITSSVGDSNYFETKIYMDYGTEYGIDDDIMRRGNKYYIGYEIEVDADGSKILYPAKSQTDSPSDYGLYGKVEPEKETPTLKMFIARSTENSITYRYEMVDPDNALYRESSDDSYGFYYAINAGDEHKLIIDKVVDEDNKFSGDVTIEGLNNGDEYTLYYKKNAIKTGIFSDDVLNYFDGEDNGNRIFDGYYDANDEQYNFKYTVINNPLIDNKVTIKILTSDVFLERIISYKIKFTDAKGNVLNKELWKLSACEDREDELEKDRCLSVDYVELKNAGMKSENNSENVITVSVDAVYDNGLTGYDYTVGTSGNYPYMIMQNNIVPGDGGKYISFSNRGQLTNWSEAIDAPKGYYTYYFLGNQINYSSKLNTSHKANITYNLSASGYLSNLGILNPKMISVDSMTGENKAFSFSSITPKISIGRTTRLLNGAIAEMTLSGADITDFCEDGNGSTCVNNDDSEFYLYVEMWSNPDYVGDLSRTVRPTLKFKINNNNTSEKITAVLDKVNNAIKYYYNVYAYMNKNDRKVYTQLFDVSYTDRYETKTYEFTSLSSDDIFHTFDVSYKANDEGNYGDRLLNTKINLLSYENNVPFNFDIGYAFCEYGDATCGIRDNETKIFKSTVSMDNLSTSFTDTVDISEYDIEYGKDYYVYIFAIFDYYDIGNLEVNTKTLQLNRRSIRVNLRELATPDFVVSREAKYEDGDYVIDFNINVRDTDRTLLGGEYFVKLLSVDGNMVGDLQILGSDGTFNTVATNGDYENYVFDATVTNKSIRIKNLEPDTKYTIVVYSRAYLNNYSETVPKEERTVDVSKSHTVYSVNNSGVAFGRDLLFSATEKSIVVTFLGGSNFDNVREVDYTIGLWDNEQSTSTFSGSYVLADSNKKFEMYKDTGDWRFVIDPDSMENVLGQTYTVALAFYVENPETGELDYYDSVTNPSFAGRTQYVKDNKSNNN